METHLETYDVARYSEPWWGLAGCADNPHTPWPARLWSDVHHNLQTDGGAGIILYMRPANERQRYSVTSSLIG